MAGNGATKIEGNYFFMPLADATKDEVTRIITPNGMNARGEGERYIEQPDGTVDHFDAHFHFNTHYDDAGTLVHFTQQNSILDETMGVDVFSVEVRNRNHTGGILTSENLLTGDSVKTIMMSSSAGDVFNSLTITKTDGGVDVLHSHGVLP